MIYYRTVLMFQIQYYGVVGNLYVLTGRSGVNVDQCQPVFINKDIFFRLLIYPIILSV